ncbi:hypothetical protein GLOTRDRAFT_31418 [Gloeophyllum trabeum ATCC 11539]|uniref:Cora-domain-containing protein n=1 Tax=Gloeophyllum trabeum (strain ATCC 11539 / FP-39264 / Madison 617) TaxID=670483 RepID=S7QMK0_GLOTA|nr:uncharacterized protein GLOTRDRAFT_31418 [Gloeophyllum trabeum ATCC 11539]EPQ60678.1 hypothetical protein GLOTRDRAFT_31418 [Gloeophyllum trabeum ATCC 11539]
MKKGKRKENGVDPGRTTPSSGTSTPASKARQVFPQRAWWLDVASPTWEDMKAIGQLLHIHPLTLEDILQQDPREKLELFPKLGYYFIVFKALESVKTQERFFRSQLNGDTYFPQDEGFVGEAMVYLVVFREGVISFHYSDISEHTDRVRNKLLLMDEDVNVSNASSDWIAHGILDSIVDSFFPFQEGIEMEIAAIEDLVFSDNHLRLKESPLPEVVTPNFQMPEKPSDAHPKDEEKRLAPAERTRTRFADPTPTIPLLVRRLRRAIRSRILPKAQISTETKSAMSSTAMTLRRMAKARRLLTTSTRLLSTKHEVVAQIKKRLLNEGALPKGTGAGDEIEVAMYMGDVQDHILTLQHSLVHYERILSQLHPTYLSQLRVSVSTTKQGSDKAIMVLSIVSIAVLCCQAVIGCFSMNVTVPTNGQEPGYPYNMFYVVLSIAVVALCLYGCLVRYWWVRSKRRRTTML